MGSMSAPETDAAPVYVRLSSETVSPLLLAFLGWSDNGGTMPGEDYTFTTHVDPISPPIQMHSLQKNALMVEAPGTAPGSATLITCSVYRHS